MKTLILILLSANVFCQHKGEINEGDIHYYKNIIYRDSGDREVNKNIEKWIDRTKDTIPTDSDIKLTLPNEEDENIYNIEISDTQIVLGGKYIKGTFYPDPQFLDTENYIRDNCGQWWERNIEYGEWEQGKRDKPEFTIYKMEYWENHSLRNCCNYISECKPEYESELKEYRFDPSNKIEYSRTVKVTYKKIEL